MRVRGVSGERESWRSASTGKRVEVDPSGFLWTKVRKRWHAWRAAGASERVLQWIRTGVPCYWKAGAPRVPWHKGRSEVDGEEENAWLDREEERCVKSGAWKPVEQVRYCSRVFLVPKTDRDAEGRRKFRLIIDLRPLNVYCVDFKTRYETLSKLGTLIADGEECAFLSMDLADAYNCLAIQGGSSGLQDHQQYFGFDLRGKKYVMTALPFGWNQSPYCFTTAMKTLVRLLRTPSVPTVREQTSLLRSPAGRRDVSMRWVGGRRVAMWVMPQDAEEVRSRYPWDILPYCDDFLVIIHGETRELRLQREQQAKVVILGALDRLGLTRQPSKGQWEGLNWIHHLGLRIKTEGGNGTIRVTPQRVGKIRRLARELIHRAHSNRRLVPARQLASFVGLVQSCYLAIPVAQLFCRELNYNLAEKSSWTGNVRLSRQSLRDLDWWVDMPMKWNGRKIHQAAVTQLMWTDASDFAWGARLYRGNLAAVNAESPGGVAGPTAHGELSAEDRKDSITVNELRAVIWSLEAFLPQLAGCSVRMMQDNQAVMFCVRKLSSKNPKLLRLIRRFWALCDLHSIRVEMDYVRSAENPADAPSRWRFSDEWRLTPAVFTAVEQQLGVKHTIDLFASKATAQTARYVSRFPDGQCVAVDAFSLRSWAGEVCWVNCDWDLLDKVVQRLEEEPSARATVLCPYFPAQLAFTRLHRLCDRMVVMDWVPEWEERVEQDVFAPLGPASHWQVAFIHVADRS